MSAQAIVPSANVFYEMDAKDEQQILAALEGQIVDELVYEVEGKKGLSYTGVNHISFKMGHIKVLPESMRIEYDQEEDEYTAYIIAVNEKYNLSAPGVAVQPRLEQIHVVDPATGKYAKDEKGAWVWTQRKDRFAKVKAMSKATRNAKRAVIPEAMMKKYLEYFLALKTGKGVEPPSFEDTDLDSIAKKAAKKVPSVVTSPKPPAPPATTLQPPVQASSTPQEKPLTEYGAGVSEGLPPIGEGEQESQTGEGEVMSTGAIQALLEQNGCDSSLVDITEEENGIVVKPHKFLGDVWGGYNDCLRGIGATWIRAGRESRWIISQ